MESLPKRLMTDRTMRKGLRGTRREAPKPEERPEIKMKR